MLGISQHAAVCLIAMGLLAGCSVESLEDSAAEADGSTASGSESSDGGSGGNGGGEESTGEGSTGGAGGGAGGSGAGGSGAGGSEPPPAICGDGVVDAGELCDDNNDVDDDGCTACQPDGTSCAAGISVELPLGTVNLSGTTEGGGMSSHFTAGFGGPKWNCGDETGVDAPDRIYTVVPAEDGFLSYRLDAVDPHITVQIRTGCTSGHGGYVCGQEGAMHVNAGQTYYVIVDGDYEEILEDFIYEMHSGPYELELTLSKGTCASPIPVHVDDTSWFWFEGFTQHGENNGYLPECGTQENEQPGIFSEELVFEINSAVTGEMQGKLIEPGYFATGSIRTQCGDSETSQYCFANWPYTSSAMGFNHHQLTAGETSYLHVEGRGIDDGGHARLHISALAAPQ